MPPHSQKAQRYRARRKLLMAAASRPQTHAPCIIDWKTVFGTSQCTAMPPAGDDMQPTPCVVALSAVGERPHEDRTARLVRRWMTDASSQHADV